MKSCLFVSRDPMGKPRLLRKTTHESERESVVQKFQLSFHFSDSQITVTFSYPVTFFALRSLFTAYEKKEIVQD